MHTSTGRTPRWARAYVIAVTAVAGLFSVSAAVGLLAEPAGFARLVNFPYGVHYLHDAGAFQLGIGATMLLALVWRDALAVVLGGFLVGNTAHALAHLADRGLGGHPSDPWLLGVASLLAVAALALRLAELGLVLGDPGTASTPELAPFLRQKTVLLTSRRRDGRPVGTPVSIALDGARAYVRTYERAMKVRRLRRDPAVTVAPSTMRGRVTGPPIAATAVLLEGEEARDAAAALARRYPVLQGVAVPLIHRLSRQCTLHYALVPATAGVTPPASAGDEVDGRASDQRRLATAAGALLIRPPRRSGGSEPPRRPR